MTTFLAIAELSKLQFVSFDCGSTAKLEKLEGSGYQITEIILRPKLLISHDKDFERAGRIVEKAERNCLISRSIKTSVSIEPDIQVKQFVAEEQREVTLHLS
jgi:organic hydroperoxide reductase OsmC/OhrA